MTKLVCFDLDDTIMQTGVHSVMFLCLANGEDERVMEIERRVREGEIGWMAGDHLEAALMKGLELSSLDEKFDQLLKPRENIAKTVDELRRRGIHSILVTAGPKQVAEIAAKKWGFDRAYGSIYDVDDNGVFTGVLSHHIGADGKITCLEQYCEEQGISREQCVAVGDGLSDIPLFLHCDLSIAINPRNAEVEKIATHTLFTNDMYDIMQFID